MVCLSILTICMFRASAMQLSVYHKLSARAQMIENVHNVGTQMRRIMVDTMTSDKNRLVRLHV